MPYKVVRNDEGRLLSVFASGSDCLIYSPDGSIVYPKVGEIFVFKTFERARSFVGPNEEIWEVETSPLHIRYFGNGGTVSNSTWWSLSAAARRHHYNRLPRFTYTTSWVRLIKQVLPCLK